MSLRSWSVFWALVLALAAPSAGAVADVANSGAAVSTNTAANAVANNTTTASTLTSTAAINPAVASNPSNLVAGLVFLLILVLLAAWLVKRNGGMQAWRAGAAIKVVAALSMGPRERVVLIELGGQQWLLGVTPGAINTLHYFEQPIVAAGNADEFSSKLRQLLPQGFGK